jgi:DNA primase
LRQKGPVYVCEGFFDALSARQMFPENLVLGAHGCSQLAYVATVAAEVVRGTNRGIVFVPHADEAGRKAAREAVVAAIEVGLFKESISIFALENGCNDLNDHLLLSTRQAA